MRQWFPYDGIGYEDDTCPKARRTMASYFLSPFNEVTEYHENPTIVLRNWFYRYNGD